MFVPLEPVEKAGLQKFLHLVIIFKHRHLIFLNPLFICNHTIVGGLEIVLMRNQEPFVIIVFLEGQWNFQVILVEPFSEIGLFFQLA